MSWSFYAVGKASAVRKKAADEIANSNITFAEPERSLRVKLFDAIDSALAAMPEASAVSIRASGSQYTSSNPDGTFNTVKLEIEPMYGFVE
ncbi:MULTISPECIES: hypothetical protein [unclassified Bradyrhizobium]|uniref:hypothetical protein n=1 Tax=unclassified Bradyrhizobium TaxID=2631580 RepID=UPI0028EFB9F0|nr:MULTISPECIES: hypothetical protein [unclassified Bradyrhizobium]